MQLALKVERQRHSNSYRTTGNRSVYGPSRGYSKSTISDVKAASYNVEVNSEKEEGTEMQVEKPSNNHDEAIVTVEFNQDFGSSSRKKSREVKCFKCQGYGHIASQCPNKRVMTIIEGEFVVEEAEEDGQEHDDLLTTLDA